MTILGNTSIIYFQELENRTYIPFTKKNVDEIIANSAHSDKSPIRFVVKFGQEDSTDFIVQSMRMQFLYDVYVTTFGNLQD